MNKICTLCGETKSVELFYKRSDGMSDGYMSHCKLCRSKSKPKNFSHSWFQENFPKDELEVFSKLKNLWTKAKLRSKDFDPSIDWEYLFDIWVEQNGKCFYSGLPLRVERNHPHGVSLDRIDSSKGYIKGNLQLVSASVNRMKQEFNEEFFIDLCTKISDTRRKTT